MRKKLFVISVFLMLLICSISVNANKSNIKNEKQEQSQNFEEKSITIYEGDDYIEQIEDVIKINNKEKTDFIKENPKKTISTSNGDWIGFESDEWYVLVDSNDWGKIGKVNQIIDLYKLKYDESEKYDWYSIKWTIQSVPGIILWEGKDWRTDKINNWADCDEFDPYVKLIKYGPYGDHNSHTIGVQIGVTGGEDGAEVTAMFTWAYTQEDFMQFDYSDFSDQLASWMHDDMNDDLQQSITVEPGFTIRVPQAEDFDIYFRTHVKFHDPFPWNPDQFFTQKLTWKWTNWDHNFKPDTPAKPSGPVNGEGDEGESIKFSARTVDPDGGDVKYLFDWGDGDTTTTGWKGSNVLVEESHTWEDSDTSDTIYSVKVKAQDRQGIWSDFSDPFYVTIKDDDDPPCCFPAGTKITMADGSKKNIEDIKIGDNIMSYDLDSNQYNTWRVKMLGQPIHPVLTINNGLLQATVDHPLYVKKQNNQQGWAMYDTTRAERAITMKEDKILELEIGDKLKTLDGKWITIEKINLDPKPVQTYNILSISGTKTYYANNVLVYEEHPPHSMSRFYLNRIEKVFPRLVDLFRSSYLYEKIYPILP